MRSSSSWNVSLVSCFMCHQRHQDSNVKSLKFNLWIVFPSSHTKWFLIIARGWMSRIVNPTCPCWRICSRDECPIKEQKYYLPVCLYIIWQSVRVSLPKIFLMCRLERFLLEMCRIKRSTASSASSKDLSAVWMIAFKKDISDIHFFLRGGFLHNSTLLTNNSPSCSSSESNSNTDSVKSVKSYKTTLHVKVGTKVETTTFSVDHSPWRMIKDIASWTSVIRLVPSNLQRNVLLSLLSKTHP